MKQTQWHSSKGNFCRQMTLTKQKLLLEILYTSSVATKTSRIPRKAFLGEIFCLEYPSTRSEKGNVHFANYRFPFRKLQIFISQTTDSHFANYRFSFRKLQIFISQTTDFHFANYRFPFRKLQIPISQTTDFHFHFVSSHFVSQTTVSRCILHFEKSDSQQENIPSTKPSKPSCRAFEIFAAK